MIRLPGVVLCIAGLATACGGGATDPSAPNVPLATRAQPTVTDPRGAGGADSRDLRVTAPAAGGPALAFSDSILSFCYRGGMRYCWILSEDIRITSTGGRALTWTAVSNQPWIVVKPARGTTPTRVKVSVILTKMPRYAGLPLSGAVKVSAAGATNSPQTLPVSLCFCLFFPPR